MRLSELIKELQQLQEEHGNIKVVWESIERYWSPEPVVRTNASGTEKVVVLNS